MGRWTKLHGRSIYGCTQAPAEFRTPANCLLTWNPEAKRLYVHVLEWPMGVLALDGLAGCVEYAQLLNDASEVRFSEETDESGFMAGKREEKSPKAVILQLPVLKPAVEVPVIELYLK